MSPRTIPNAGSAAAEPLKAGPAVTAPEETKNSAARPLVPGVYVPTVCFFCQDKAEEVDTKAIARHAQRLARAGVQGLATQGSAGEAVHLSAAERGLVTKTTRDALDAAGFSAMPIIVGCGSQSTRETIALCRQARAAGGDYALVLPPSYYGSLFAPDTVVNYFFAVADASPVPLIIYNYPGAVSGLDLSSDTVLRLARHANIRGVKLTCGDTGKLNRVAAETRLRGAGADTFFVLAGSADFALPALVAGGHGILAGLANLAPASCLRVVNLHHRGDAAGARAAQEILSRGDWVAIQGGVVGIKAAMETWLGYGGFARSPLPRPGERAAAEWAEGFRELMDVEMKLG